MYRYAVFYRGDRNKPWSVQCQSRVFGFLWAACYEDYYDDEVEAMRHWHRLIERERARRTPGGEQKTEWKP